SGRVDHEPHSICAYQTNAPEPAKQRVDSLQALGGAQRFLSTFSGISPHFRPRRHLMTAPDYRTEMQHRFTTWEQVTGTAGLSTAA
ncbi:IS6 family transposase, partial [Streptomyces sp. NPDC007164]